MKTAHRGTFILSFDCESKWGLADRLTDHHRRNFTTRRVFETYQNLVALLSALDLSGTFAFVGALTITPEQFQEFAERFVHSAAARKWLRPLEKDLRDRNYEGWFVPELLDEVMRPGQHEIASHGFMHLIFDESRTSPSEADLELRTAVDVGKMYGLTLETFIFPRNVVGHTRLLGKHGFLAYRDGYHRKRRLIDKAKDFAAELNLMANRPAPPSDDREPLCLPAGYFVNWRRGARKLIPIDATVLRWERIIDSAVREGSVAHAWLHPHNLIDGDRQFELLERILTNISRRIKAGDLCNMTQLEYTRQLTQPEVLDMVS